MPGMRLAPSASTRARSTASNTSAGPPAPGASCLCSLRRGRRRSAQAVGPAADHGDLALRRARARARAAAPSCRPIREARREADLEIALSPAMARTDSVTPASTARRRFFAPRQSSCAQLSATLAALSRQLLAEAALIELGHQAALELVALVEEGERKAKPMSPKISAFSAQVMTVRGLITVDRSPLMKALRVRSATRTMCDTVLRLASVLANDLALASTIFASSSCGR